MSLPLTRELMLGQLTRMNDIWRKYHDGQELARATASYHEALNDLDLQQVAGGVALAIKEESRMPYPSKLREYALRWTGANRITLKPPKADEGAEYSCRVCQATPRRAWLRTATGDRVARYVIACDRSKHGPQSPFHIPLPESFDRWCTGEDA
jgi:hypothetical protein